MGTDVKTRDTGNVKTARKRDISINLRVTREEKKEMERCAAILRMTQTELVMNGVKIISGMIEKHRENQKTMEKDQEGDRK